MEIRKQQLVFVNQSILRFNRFFHFKNHIRRVVDILDGRQNLSTSRFIFLVGKSAVLSSCMLHKYCMTVLDQFSHTRRSHTYTILVVFDNVSVKELDGKVIFLRKLERGGSAHSFGIHVAKLAGMPKSIVKRSEEILKELEANNSNDGVAARPMKEIGENREGYQLSFFQLDDPVLCQIRD